ncbi:hypothetical protein NL676_031833 [Syzygium grande]|nr:hypothetical protein NL676_031833 [Syzygium grande]
MGAELYYTQRGGDITFHGPHQAILYPIISLRDIGLGARKYVEKLELTMIELASLYGARACPGQSGETGVWVGDRKIGAIGVSISNGITSHGLAFNINPDLNYFKHIVPCGIEDKEVTSLKRETDMVLPTEEVIEDHAEEDAAVVHDNVQELSKTGKGGRDPQKLVKANLRTAPPSKSNPSQNNKPQHRKWKN